MNCLKLNYYHFPSWSSIRSLMWQLMYFTMTWTLQLHRRTWCNFFFFAKTFNFISNSYGPYIFFLASCMQLVVLLFFVHPVQVPIALPAIFLPAGKLLGMACRKQSFQFYVVCLSPCGLVAVPLLFIMWHASEANQWHGVSKSSLCFKHVTLITEDLIKP